jgi:hypothetical protein
MVLVGRALGLKDVTGCKALVYYTVLQQLPMMMNPLPLVSKISVLISEPNSDMFMTFVYSQVLSKSVGVLTSRCLPLSAFLIIYL